MSTLAALTFAAPLMLLGGLAIALPVIAHFMSRRAKRRIVFPTIRLLAECRASQSSLYRLRRYILLALRCLAVLLIAAAFAQPGCESPEQAAAAGGEGASVVIVLDVSASLSRDTDGVSLRDAMRALTERALSSLEPGLDRVNVVPASSRPTAMFPIVDEDAALTANIDAARSELASVELTNERADLPAALALAGRMLENAPGQRRVVIVSDMQRSNWVDVALGGAAVGSNDDVDASASSRLGLLPAGTRITVLPLEAASDNQLALSSPRAAPVRPIVNRPTQLLVDVTNFGEQPATVMVMATLDGQPLEPQSVTLDAGEAREIAFDAVLPTAGRHRVEFALPDDRFALDNRAYLSLDAVVRVPVLLVSDDDADQPGSAAYFLLRALSPHGDDRDMLTVRQTMSAAVASEELADYEAVFVGEVAALSDDAARAIAEYVQAGGGVALFAGDGPVAENVKLIDEAMREAAVSDEETDDEDDETEADSRSTPHATRSVDAGDAESAPLMPLTFDARRDLGSVGNYVRLGEINASHPMLADFDDASIDALKRIRFHKVWSVDRTASGADVVMRFTDGEPALGVGSVGEGRVVVANFSPALASSDLGKYATFVALARSIEQYVRPRHAWRRQATIGQPFSVAVAIPVGEGVGRIVVRGPNDETYTAELSRRDRRVIVTVERPPVAGFYHVERNGATVAGMAVNLDPRESDLRSLDGEALAQRMADDGANVEVRGDAVTTDAPVLDVRGRPLWHVFVVLAMVFIAFELLLLSVWRQ